MDNPFRVKRSNVGQAVYEQVKQLILLHQIQPGEKIGLVPLAEKLDVSLTPLREALTRLKEDGFVVHLPNRGYFAAEITAQEVKELYDVREAIESHALTLSVSQLEEQAVRAITSAIEEHGRAVTREDRFFEDKALHLCLAAPCRNQLLLRILEQMLDRAIMKLRIGALPPERGPAAHKEHLGILEALKKRDGQKAVERLRAHLRNSREYILAFLETHETKPERAALVAKATHPAAIKRRSRR